MGKLGIVALLTFYFFSGLRSVDGFRKCGLEQHADYAGLFVFSSFRFSCGFGVVQIMYGPTNPDPCLINLSP